MENRDHQVRAAVAGDVPCVAAVTDAAYRHYIDRIGLTPAPMEADHAADVAARRVYVTGRPPAGVVVLVEEAGYLLLASIAVRPDAQGTGTGRALLGFAERRARELGLPEVRLYTHALMWENQALYERIGYALIGRRVDGPYDRLYYRKPVGPG
ncbi:GNAT family N-acetyltransferase [Streptomyces sp. NBC_01497]|uniref:GNAT family N-acetyltransferase n=1 Tax=Streptomyces sp. NBC_01497 TaxID=2903885 RepID=UPI002E35FBCE|nr:GNAT family N-acetyltransferase [Streptomyces sp. NBC_01497]